MITLTIIDGIDRGREFPDLRPPVTIGREEGNSVRLNDERVSRFHAKLQEDQGQLVITDLDSTNGTRVNGEAIQLRLLRPGDRVAIGRSTLVVGHVDTPDTFDIPESSSDFPREITDPEVNVSESSIDPMDRPAPALPSRLTPAQAAQLSEMLDHLHRALADSLDEVHIPPRAKEGRIPATAWQRLQRLQTLLSRYSRDVAEPNR
jgi:hypothetical protein